MAKSDRSDLRLPEMMKAVRQYAPVKDPVIELLPLPVPGHGEVLIQMHASPVNPSDLSRLREVQKGLAYPFTPGLEGSGLVVRSGGGMLAGMRLGKRVACSPKQGGDGTWAAFMVTDAAKTVTLPASLSYEEGSMMLVNPMTAHALIQLARKGKHRAIVNNAAASALGRMLFRLGQRYGIQVINIVRNSDQEAELTGMGARYVLNSSQEGYIEKLRDLASSLEATLFLDAVTGKQTSLLLNAAPRGSVLIAYARLSGEEILADPADLIREEKQIKGFQLANWLQGMSLPEKLRFIQRVKRDMDGLLTTRIHRSMPVEQVVEAIDHYKKNMSAGKIILLMNEEGNHSG